MPTIIHFVGREQLMVREDDEQVQAAFVACEGGRPMVLTHQRSGSSVFVNPGQVIYWQGRGTRQPSGFRRNEARHVSSLR